MNHDVIVIGASAGGIPALKQVLAELPKDLHAAVFIVLHTAPQTPRVLAQILDEKSAIPVSYAEDGHEFEQGRAYLAPPDYHLVLRGGRMALVRGPKENLSRPSVDALFRSAASSFANRVIGVILSGSLNDGTSGLADIKQCGGLAVVQDPADAISPGMPESALRHVKVDHQADLAHMPELLTHLVEEEIAAESKQASDIPQHILLENKATLNHGITTQEMDQMGEHLSIICPECSGPLWKISPPHGVPHYRCHVGHSYTGETLSIDQETAVDRALAVALRTLEDSVTVARQLADQAETDAKPLQAQVHRITADRAAADVEVVKKIIMRKAGRGGVEC